MQYIITIYAIIFSSILTSPAYAFDAEQVHPDINEGAINQSLVNQYLSDVLVS